MAPNLIHSLPRERSECFGYQRRIATRLTMIPVRLIGLRYLGDRYHGPEIEAIVEPNCITDDIRRESVAFIGRTNSSGISK